MCSWLANNVEREKKEYIHWARQINEMGKGELFEMKNKKGLVPIQLNPIEDDETRVSY